jgi:hypothetical protein
MTWKLIFVSPLKIECVGMSNDPFLAHEFHGHQFNFLLLEDFNYVVDAPTGVCGYSTKEWDGRKYGLKFDAEFKLILRKHPDQACWRKYEERRAGPHVSHAPTVLLLYSPPTKIGSSEMLQRRAEWRGDAALPDPRL